MGSQFGRDQGAIKGARSMGPTCSSAKRLFRHAQRNQRRINTWGDALPSFTRPEFGRCQGATAGVRSIKPTCSSAKRLFSCLASMPSWCVCCSLYTSSALRLFSCATAATAWQARVTISSLGSLSQPFTDSAACNQTTQLWKGKERKGKARLSLLAPT